MDQKQLDIIIARAKLVDSISFTKADDMWFCHLDHPDLCGKTSLPIAMERSMSGRCVSAFNNLLEETKAGCLRGRELFVEDGKPFVAESSKKGLKRLVAERDLDLKELES